MSEETRQVKRRIDRRKKKRPLWKKIMLSIGAVMLLLAIGIGGLLTYYVATAPALDPEKLSDPVPVELYDRNGELFATLATQKRTKITYDDLPPLLIDAVTATEDARFFEHPGIDIRRIGGAIKANLTDGFGSQGASTITQQVVENSFLTPDKEIKLKVQEQWLSLKLEREYSKEQIMEMYLNKIYYGSGAYGVAKASETYFGKTDLHELSIAESAILAGLPQRPSGYNPFNHPDLMTKRMNTVLDLMVRHDKITREEAEEAKKVDIESLLTEKRPDSKIPYQAYRKQIQREVDEKLDGIDINSGGLKIYTNMDPNAQEYVETLLKDGENNPMNYPDQEMQLGSSILDTKTGGIVAIGGRRNPDGSDQFNFAVQGGSQSGSTAKPIISYGPAIEKNKLSTYHQINDDKPYEVAGSSAIRNWNRKYSGVVSMRYALAQSLNVPAVKTLEDTGLEDSKKFAEGLGIKFKDDKIGIRDAIGGTETNVSPLQMAGAYQAFGNDGIYNEPHAVTKIEFPDGKTVDLSPDPTAAMSDYTAYMITDMLKTVVSSGTGTEANVSGVPVAGKTGTTTHSDKSGSPDAWFVGYSSNYTMSVWAGGYKDENGKSDVIPTESTKIPQTFFRHMMTELSKNVDTADFKKPSSVVELNIVPGSNPARVASSGGTRELFVKGHAPNDGNTKPKPKEEVKDTFPAVNGLEAKYDEDDNLIDISWDHDADDDAVFEISVGVDGANPSSSGTTEDDDYTIKDVKKGAKYTINVVATNKEEKSQKSESRSVTLETGEAEEAQSLGAIKSLQGRFVEDSELIDVTWEYDGSSAKYEVSVSPNEQDQTVSSKGLEITGVKRGETYTITVTPISDDGEKGSSATTTVAVPNREEEQPEEQPEEEPEPEPEEEPEEDEPVEPEEPEEKEEESDSTDQDNQGEQDQDNNEENSDPEEN